MRSFASVDNMPIELIIFAKEVSYAFEFTVTETCGNIFRIANYYSSYRMVLSRQRNITSGKD